MDGPPRLTGGFVLPEQIAWARRVAMRVMYKWPLSEWEDGFGDALLGLTLAMRDYDPQMGASFGTYAGRRIKGAMLDGVRRRNGRRSMGKFVPHPKMVPLNDPDFAEDHQFVRAIDPPDPQAEQEFRDFEEEDLARRAVRLFERLSDRERMIMTLYFFEGMPLWEIGQTFDLTESRVSQIVSLTCKRLLRLLDQ